MLYTLFAEVEYAGLAAIAGAHARLELRIVVHATVGFVVTHAHPRLFDILVQLKFVLWVHSDSDLVTSVDVSDILLDARHDCICDYLSVRVLNHSFLHLRPSHSDGFTLFCRLTRTHV